MFNIMMSMVDVFVSMLQGMMVILDIIAPFALLFMVACAIAVVFYEAKDLEWKKPFLEGAWLGAFKNFGMFCVGKTDKMNY